MRRSALTLAESGNLLMIRGRARDQGSAGGCRKSAIGSAAYAAAQAKDLKVSSARGAARYACTSSHALPANVFPRDGGSR